MLNRLTNVIFWICSAIAVVCFGFAAHFGWLAWNAMDRFDAARYADFAWNWLPIGVVSTLGGLAVRYVFYEK